MLHSLKDMIGYIVQATDRPAGRVADFYVDDVTWTVRHVAVADSGGIGIQLASVEPDQIGSVDARAKRLNVKRTQGDIAGGPDVSLDLPVSRHIDRQNDSHLRSVDEIVGYTVMAADGAAGTIADFLVDEQNWKIGVIVVAGGGGRPVMVGPGLIDRLDFDAKTAHLEFDGSHFERSPVYDPTKKIARVEDVALLGSDLV